MIKHIVFWRFLELTAEGSRKDNIKQAQKLLLAMKDKIEGIIDLKVGENIQNDENASDIVLIITFTDIEALKIYQNHPAHLEVKDFLSKVRYERRVIDYEIKDL